MSLIICQLKLNQILPFSLGHSTLIKQLINDKQKESKQKFFFQNVKKDIMARPAAQNAGAAQMEKRVIKTAGSVIAVAFLTF